MRGSEFFAAFRGKTLPEWEAAAIEMVKAGNFVRWPVVQVPLDALGKATVGVLADYFAVGEPDDFFYLPLTPIAAQKIADALGLMLPTTKIVRDTWRNAGVQIEPEPMRPIWLSQKLDPDKRMVTLDGYHDHNVRVLDALKSREPSQLVSGTKKDVVLSNRIRPDAPGKQGSVAIYGWFDKEGKFVKAGQPIQGLNPSDHVNTYADYSHGIRYVEPFVTVNGERKSILDPSVANLVTDEGAIKVARYETGTPAPKGAPTPQKPPSGPPSGGGVASLPVAPKNVPASILGSGAASSEEKKIAPYVLGGFALLGLAAWAWSRHK